MHRPITFMEKLFTGYPLIDVGYSDYIAARFLLNNRFVIQGLTLASTAVEKYWKALIVFNSKNREKYHYHFDNLEKLKDLLSKNCPDLIQKFDPVFLNVLENAFKIRYHDRLKKTIFIGIYLNQVIAELDFTIDLLEKEILQTQGEVTTHYQRAIRNNDRNLYDNNYILSQQTKKDFMEKPDSGFLINIHNLVGSSNQSVETVTVDNVTNIYEGTISTFSAFRPNSFSV
jgi:hypothetical protein